MQGFYALCYDIFSKLAYHYSFSADFYDLVGAHYFVKKKVLHSDQVQVKNMQNFKMSRLETLCNFLPILKT